MTIAIVVEGDTDLPVARKLVADAGLTAYVEIDCAGKARVDEEFGGYNSAAKGSPWLVLRDLNHDAACPSEFIRARSVAPSRWMSFRLAVRELEAWLLADAAGLSAFLGVPVSAFPTDPDSEEDPTRTLVNLARRSRRRAVQRAMVPRPGAHTLVGPLYEAKVIEFGQNHWDLARACERSDSLRRARRGLRALGVAWRAHTEGR